MKDWILVAIAAIFVLVLMLYQLHRLKGFHRNAEWLIGILNQLGREPSKWQK